MVFTHLSYLFSLVLTLFVVDSVHLTFIYRYQFGFVVVIVYSVNLSIIFLGVAMVFSISSSSGSGPTFVFVGQPVDPILPSFFPPISGLSHSLVSFQISFQISCFGSPSLSANCPLGHDLVASPIDHGFLLSLGSLGSVAFLTFFHHQFSSMICRRRCQFRNHFLLVDSPGSPIPPSHY